MVLVALRRGKMPITSGFRFVADTLVGSGEVVEKLVEKPVKSRPAVTISISCLVKRFMVLLC